MNIRSDSDDFFAGFPYDLWNPRAFNTCTITDGCIGFDFPYECSRELSLAGYGCRVGHIARNYIMFKMTYGMAGIEALNGITNVSQDTKVFTCPLCENPYGSSPWVVEHIYSSISKPAFVSQSMSCNCLRPGIVYERSWKETIGLKYESAYLAGCAVAFFIGRRTNYFPKDIDIDDSGVELTYHKDREDAPEQILRLELSDRDGGFYIEVDPLNWKSRIQCRGCAACGFRNMNMHGSRMMFGLDCNRHAACEKCVFVLLTSRNPMIPGFRRGWCSLCSVNMSDCKLHVEIGNVKCLRAPVAYGYLGEKAVLCPILYYQLEPIYREDIEWAVAGRKESSDSLLSCQNRLAGEKAKLTDAGSNFGASHRSVDSINKGIRLLEAACLRWEAVLSWLGSREDQFRFAIGTDIPFPRNLLDQDRIGINRNLEKSVFDMLRNKAICSHWNAEEHLAKE